MHRRGVENEYSVDDNFACGTGVSVPKQVLPVHNDFSWIGDVLGILAFLVTLGRVCVCWVGS